MYSNKHKHRLDDEVISLRSAAVSPNNLAASKQIKKVSSVMCVVVLSCVLRCVVINTMGDSSIMQWMITNYTI